LPLSISNTNVSAVPFLRYQELVSDNGGPIAVRQVGEQLVPESALYRVEAKLEEDAPNWSLTRQQPGMLVIDGASRSWLLNQFRRVFAVFLRETGF
jgi:putative peptide zinc metalloprotease protein